MKKANYPYYALLIFIEFVFLAFIIKTDLFHVEFYIFLQVIYLFYCSLWPSIFYNKTKEKGLKEFFYISHYYELDCSCIWIDTIHQELACLYLFNPFQIQYISLDRIHNADYNIKYFYHKQYVSYMTLRFSIDCKKYALRILTSQKRWIHAESKYIKNLAKEMHTLTDILNHQER